MSRYTSCKFAIQTTYGYYTDDGWGFVTERDNAETAINDAKRMHETFKDPFRVLDCENGDRVLWSSEGGE